jgi:hypothetical protein
LDISLGWSREELEGRGNSNLAGELQIRQLPLILFCRMYTDQVRPSAPTEYRIEDDERRTTDNAIKARQSKAMSTDSVPIACTSPHHKHADHCMQLHQDQQSHQHKFDLCNECIYDLLLQTTMFYSTVTVTRQCLSQVSR